MHSKKDVGRIKNRVLCIFFSVLVLLSANLPTAFAAEEGILPSGCAYSEIGEKIDAFVEEHRDTTAGMTTAVFDRNGFVYEGYFGYANKEAEVAADAQTVMEWGSVTKLTVWVSVMQLWEQGRIDLNEDIQVYLPEGFLKNLRYEKPITMLDLMNHTAGFEEVAFGLYADDAESILSLEEALSRCQPVQRFEPGTVQAYSNYGAALAGYLVERISGQPYDAYAKEHIFEPLGMQHTAIAPDLSDNPWVRAQRAQLQCYREDGSPIQNRRECVNLYPCGMCTSTLGDLMRFGQALLNPGSPLFESPATYEELFSPSAYCGDTDVPSCYHGFWPIFGWPAFVYHDGATTGCSSALYLDLESGTGMAVMTNQRFEETYNYEMPALVFSDTDREDPEEEAPESYNPYDSGIVELSRNIWTGPLKLYRLFNIVPLAEITDFVTETDSDGLRRYSSVGGDWLPVSLPTVILMYASVGLWTWASLFSLILLLIRLARKLRHRARSVFGAWEIWSCLAQLPFPILMLPLAQSLINLEWWPMRCYKLCFIGAFVLCAAMAALFVRELLRRRGGELTNRQKLLRVVLLANLLISVGNILYWNLFMFWKVP